MSAAERPILVTGAAGMVGRAFVRAAEFRGVSIVGLSRSELDVTDHARVVSVTREISPIVILNLAAYTAVDRAEREPDSAMAVNQQGAANVAAASRKLGARMVHVSTDYVFDGREQRPYRPTDSANPVNVYGRTKWLGEESIRAELEDHLIVRTSWVFAPWGKNFVRTIARRVRETEPIRIAADQCGRPTSALDLANALLDLAGRRDLRGTIHFANEGPTTWHAFAEVILAMLRDRDGSVRAEVVAVSTADLTRAAARPAYSVLDTEGFTATTGTQPRGWKPALSETLDELT